MRRILITAAVVTSGAVAGVWYGNHQERQPATQSPATPIPPENESDVELLDGDLQGVDYDVTRRLLDDAIAAHGESLYEFQTAPTRAEVLTESTKRRAVADAELDDAYRHIELRDRSPIGSKEYIDHDRESARHSRAAIAAAAAWHRATSSAISSGPQRTGR